MDSTLWACSSQAWGWHRNGDQVSPLKASAQGQGDGETAVQGHLEHKLFSSSWRHQGSLHTEGMGLELGLRGVPNSGKTLEALWEHQLQG